MVTRIGGIVVDIDARLAKLEKELERGNRELRKFEKNATASGSRVEQGLVGISKGVGTVVGTLGGLGVALGAGALLNFGKSALAMGDDLATAADQVGIGVERFQTLRQVFRELEVDGDTFDKAMMRLVTTLGDVQSGATNQATAALDKMGITARILSGEIDTTDELLDAIAGSTTKFGTEAEFTSAIVDIFGRRAGPQLAAAFGIGREGIQAMEADIRRLGTVLTEEQINKLADANESIEKFAQTAQYGFAIFAGAAIDALGEVAEWVYRFEENVHGAIILLANLAGFEGPAGSRQIDREARIRRNRDPLDGSDVNDRLGFNITSPRKVSAAPVRITRPSGSGRGGASGRSGGGGGGVREADSFSRTMAEMARSTANARIEFTQLNEQWDDVTITDAKERAEALRKEQEEGTKWTQAQRTQFRAAAEDSRYWAVQLAILKQNQEAFNNTLTESDLSEFSSLPRLEADLEKIAGTLPDLRSQWDIALADIDDAQGVAFEGLTRNLEGALLGFQSLEDAAENFGKQLLSMALQAFVFAPLGKALKIPGYAGGTNNHPGGLAVVGEEGPELVNLPRGSQVIPNNRLMNMSNPRIASVGMGGQEFNQTIIMRGAVDLATRGETVRLAGATKSATEEALRQKRRRSGR